MATAAQSTPQKIRSTADKSYTHAATLDKARDALVRTATATTVSLATIVDTLFPSVTSTQVDNVLGALEIQDKIKGEGWTAFESMCSRKHKKGVGLYEPCHSSQREDTTFKNLEQVFEQVRHANASLHKKLADNDSPGDVKGASGQTSLVTLSIHGNKNLAGDWPNSTRPDGSIHLKKTSLPWPRVRKNDSDGTSCDVIDYADICLLIEAKLHMSPDNVNDNRSKLLWTAHHKLRSDPRCRFVAGITVENTQMQFWYFDRAGILVSTPFNFMLEPRKLIQILLGYIVAPNDASLGFDPTISCTGIVEKHSEMVPKPDEDSARVYEIKVQDCSGGGSTTTFRTIRCLANFGAVGICGRGTRVWEVTKVDEPDSKCTYVLKDVWIDEDRTTEGARLRDIHDNASPEELQFFLNIECHGVVLINEVELTREDKTFNLLSSAVANSQTLLMQYAPQPPAPPLPTSPNTSAGSGSRASASASSKATAKSQRSSSASSRATAKSQPSSSSGGSSGAKQRFTTASKGAYPANDEPPPTPPAVSGRRRHYRIAFADPPGYSIKDLTSPSDAFEALHGGLQAMEAMLRQNLIHRDISAGNILLIEREGEKMGVLMDLEYTKEFPGDGATPHTVRTGTKQFMAVEVLFLRYLFQPKSRKPYHLAWSHNPLHDVESTWWITVWILYYLTEMDLSDDDKRHREKLFSTAHRDERLVFFRLCTGWEGFYAKLPATIGDILLDWRLALVNFYEEQQLDLEHGSHKQFKYDEVITDAIGRVDSIRSTLINLPI